MAEQLPFDTQQLTKDIFNAEERTDRGESKDFFLPKPMSAAEVVTEYANKYADGNVDKFVEQLNGQSYRLTEVINHAVENPYSYSEYDKLVKIREATPQAAPEAPVDYLDMEVESVGEMGVFWDDVPVEEYDTVAVSKVDDNYPGLIKAAEMTEGILSDSATQEMLKWEDRQDIDTKWIQTNTIENLKKQGKFLGQDGFDDAYNKEFKKVTNTLMLKNVQGVHNATPRMALSEWADPSSALGSEVIAAMSPQMKFLGVGKANQLLYVTESYSRYGTDIIDAPKMAAIGLLKYGPSEFERGIAERSMATTELYKAGAATGIPGLQYLGGLTGLVLDIGTPDLTVVGGIAVKGAKMAVKTGTKLNKAVKGLQDVTKVAPESEIVAKRLMEIGKTLEKAAETGDRAAVKDASRQYAELRGEYPALRKQIDRGVESYQAERVEQIKDAVKSTDFEPDDVRALQAREALQSAGELKLKRVVSTTENVDDVIGELARDIELRVGKRKEEAQGPIFAFDTADTPRFDFQFNALDKAEQALVKKGEYRTDTEKVRKQFISIIAAKMNEFKDAAGVKTVSTDDPDIAKVFRSIIGTKNKRPINEVKDDLLLVIEKRAGIGNHSDEALFKAETNISKLISKYADEKIDVFEEAAAARNLRMQKAEAANIKKEKTIKEARQLQKDIDAELKVLRRNQRLKVQSAKRIGDDLTDTELRLSGAQEIAGRSKAVRLAVQKINRLEKIKTQLINKGARLIEASLLQKMEDAKFIAKYYKTDATRKAVEKSVIEYNSIMAKIDFGSVWRNDRRNIIDADAITSEIFKDYIETLYTELEQHRKRLTRLRGRIKTDSSRQALERYKALTRQYKQATETVKAYKQEVRLLKAELAATNKQLRQINSFVGKLERQLKKSLRTEATFKAKKVKEVAPQIDIEGAVKRFDEQLIDSVVDAVDDLADYFYGRGKLFAALEQVAATRAAVNFNMKTTGEALQLLASRIEAGKRISATMLLDTARTREIRNTASVQELISRKPDLDPAAVPSALELLATKYGVTAEAISDGILNNKPIAVTKPSGETVLIDANLVSKTYLSEGHAAFVSARRQSPKYSLRESFEGIDQESASGAIDVMLKTEGTDASVFKRAAEFVKDFTIGGTVSPELLNLSPPMRKMIQRLSRSVSQTVGDVANLLEQGDPKAIVSYLAGQKGTFSNKRQILSSGLPSVASVYNQTIERVILKLSVKSSEDADAVRWLLSQDLNSNTGRLDINLLKEREPEKYARAAKTLQQMFVTGAKSKAVDTAKTAKETAEAMTDFERSLTAGELQTIPMPRAITDLLEFVQPDYLNAQEVTTETATFIHALYNAGNKNMSAEDAIKALITGVKNAYTGGDSAVAVERGLTALHRALPIMAAHTKAYSVIHEIGDFSLALSKTDYENWVNYTKGLPVPLEWRQTKLQELIDLTGDSVMFRAVEVMGEDRYLPREAFTAMNRALKRAEDKGVISRAGAEVSSVAGFKDYLQSIVTKMMAVRVYGALMFRSRFGIDSLYEGVSAAMQIGGMTPSVLHGVRQFSQVPAMFPGALQITHFTGRLASWATKLFDPKGPLDGAPEIVKDFARVVAEKATREDLQSYLQSIGDAAANKLSGFIGAGKWNLDVNKMLAGSDEIVEIQGAQYTYRTLRDMLVEEGVPGGSLQANYFATRLRKKLTGFGDEEASVLTVVDILKMPFDEAVDLHKMITAFSESLGERERLSMFSAFVSSGYTPIEAAEMTRRALFDYQESLSEFDYGFWRKMLIPYWTFHKNNARLQFDSMFDPITAYRAGVVRKGPEAAMKLVQESVDDYYTDELGIQTNMLSDERQEALALYKKTLLGQLGQDRFTEEQTSFIRSMIVGIPAGYQDKGRVFGTGADTIELNAIRDILGVTDAMQVNPYVAGYVKKYQQGRPVFFFPTDLNDPETDFRKQIGASAVFNYLALPESGQAAFASHVLAMGGASTMLALGVTEMAGVHDLASSEVFFKGAAESAETFFSPDFNPVMNLILKGIGAETQQGQASVRISEASYNFLKQAGSDSIYEVPAEMVGDKVLKPQRYYMSAYGAAMLNMIPVISQAAKEVTDLGKENIALTGDPVFDFSLNTMRLFGLQIERGDREAVMRQAQPSDTIRTYRPQN